MKKIFAIIGLVLGTITALAQETAAPKWADKAGKAIIEVKTFDSEGKELSTGTGFFIGNGTAVADYKLFKGASAAEITDAGGKQGKVTCIMGADDTYSLVKFSVDMKKNTAVTTAQNQASIGATLYILGYSRNKKATCPSGTVSEVTAVDDACPYYTLSGTIDDKYVGAPLFNADGELVGTLQPSVGGTAYALGAKFIDNLKIDAISSKAAAMALSSIGIQKGLPESMEESLVYLYFKSKNADNDEYMNLLNQFINRYPDNSEGYYRRATPLIDLQRFDEADSDLQTYLKLSSDKAQANARIGETIHNKLVYQPTPEYAPWTYDVALSHIDKALETDARNEYKLLKAKILMSKENYKEALAIYDEFNTGADRSPATLYAACLAHDALGDSLSIQVELLDSAISMMGTPTPADAAPYVLRRGQVKTVMGRYKDAVIDYNQYLYLNNNKVNSKFYYDRSQLEVNAKMYQQALDDINTAIDKAPGEALYYVEKSALLLRVGELDECIDAAEKCVQINPDLYDAYRIMGYAQIQKGDKTNGIKNINKAIELGDESAKQLLETYGK